MSLQSSSPLQRVPLTATTAQGAWFEQLRATNTENADPLRGGLELDAPYQRGEVWTADQRRLLIKSFLLGIPIPGVIVNDRYGGGFRHPDGSDDWRYAVVDGKQRVTTILAWLDGHVDVPASWFTPDMVAATHETDDGPYVSYGELTDLGQRLFRGRMLIPVSEAKLGTLAEEADLYLLINRGGTAHSEDDLVAARTLSSTTD